METEEVQVENQENAVEEKSSAPEEDEGGDAAAGGTAASAAAAAKKKKAQAKKEKEKAAKEKEKEKEAKKKEQKKKTPGDLIKELKKEQEAEIEKLRKKEEEEERKREEAEQLRLQKLKEEQERKERKKQKEKEKIERLKKEGKYLNPEQKAKRERMLKEIELLKQSGVCFGQTVSKSSSTDFAKNNQEFNVKDQTSSPEEESAALTPVEEVKLKTDIVESWDHIEIEEMKKAELANSQEKATPSNEDDEDESSLSSELSGDEGEDKENDASKVPEGSNAELNKIKESVPERIQRRQQENLARRNFDSLRSPVICVLGHVDTGKTKILDKIRRTHVQDSEAGGITQQIGATMVPADAIKEQCKMAKDFDADKLDIPGFLIIDTPGHESFSNLRLRGSSLCDFAILVVDIMHGLEPQTIESLNMLKERKTPFIVALNKVDRLYEWKQNPHKDIRNVIKLQQTNTAGEFKDRFNEVKVQFAQQSVNVALAWENPDPSEYISMVPTSAHSGDGMGNLMWTLAQQAQTLYRDRLAQCDNLQCSVLEVKALPGLGTTIDVILVNGRLQVGDTIVVAGMEGPIVTQIRELLMPQPLREMRVKNPYEHFKEVRGAQGIKLLAKDLDKALAGLPLYVAQQEDEVDYFKEDLIATFKKILRSIKVSEKGVYVQASTLGSLEALLKFLEDQKIPYSGINIGPVHKKDVMKCSTMLEHDAQWAVILAFDVKIERDAQTMADELGVKIFSADIIYHLQDAFVKYREELRQKKRQENAHLAIFPCKLRILNQHVFKTRDPIVVGVTVEDGIVKVGTPICVPSKECITLGTVSSIESNHKAVDSARKGQEICIKIENTTGDAPKMFGRHFDETDLLISKITRETIDVCKQFFREDLQKSDWQLMVELKKIYGII